MAEKCESESDFVFVSVLEQNPCLWNPGDEGYKDRDRKKLAWKQVSEVSGVRDVEMRYRTIRDKLARRRKAPASGSSAKNFQPWTLEQSLGFLADTMAPRKTSSCYQNSRLGSGTGSGDVPAASVCIEVAGEDEDGIVFEDPSSWAEIAPASPPSESMSSSSGQKSVGKRKPTALSTAMKTISALPPVEYPKFPEFPPAPVATVNSLYLQSVALTLDSMPAKLASKVRLQIAQIVFDAEQSLE